MFIRLTTALFLLSWMLPRQSYAETEAPIQFDSPDRQIPVTLLENPLFYDAGIAPSPEGTWIAWLEFVPMEGDRLHLGLRKEGKWISQKLVSQSRDIENPTPTIDSNGALWLSYETSTNSEWQIVVQQVSQRTNGFEMGASTQFGGINHKVSALPGGGLFVLAQHDVKGVFQIGSRILRFDSTHKRIVEESVQNSKGFGNTWHPSSAIANGTNLLIAFDTYTDQSYDIFLQNSLGSSFRITDSPAFEAHAQVATGRDGRIWMAWEEGGKNWGKVYRAKQPELDKKRSIMRDETGPLHRYRKLNFAEWNEETKKLTEFEFPHPSTSAAHGRTNAPVGLKDLGLIYERAQLVVDGLNRPWIVYRHAYAAYVGVIPETHKQENMRIYARCLLPDGAWSELFQFDLGQGDGMQRIFVAPLQDGIAAAFTSGRTDRRKKAPEERGVALGEIRLSEGSKGQVAAKKKTRILSATAPSRTTASVRPTAKVGAKEFQLFYGDLHRHTDISLCFSPVDGTIDDAYRYAIDAAPLDFLGITDHTHDLDMGNPLAMIWHRSRKEVNRHALSGKFIPFYSYERSRGDTDHNVISLREDMMRPHTYPHAKFWTELDTNTFTIPHEPIDRVTWKAKDNTHRPLLEIYQGFRNKSSEADAKEGLRGGHIFGFIASSDHLSTGASYAGVWAEEPTRESLFRAMQARRTFGATARIQMKVTCGEHWMGEQFSTNNMSPLRIEVAGAQSPIEKVSVVIDGEVTGEGSLKNEGDTYHYHTAPSLSGSHFFYVHVELKDGNRAWSSPIWVDIKK